MKNFWPKRSSPKGFSIERIASNYRNRLKANIQGYDANRDVISFGQHKDSSSLNGSHKTRDIAKFHWANRDFHEYLDIA